MANQTQLKKLKQGVEGWNKWRWENTEVNINLEEADLHEANLRDCNLANANLTRVNLGQAILCDADLTKAELYQADLSGADLSGACLSDAGLGGANLSKANLKKADLILAHIGRSDFSGSNLTGARLWGASLMQVNFSKADLTEADLTITDLTGSDVRHANFHRVRLGATHLVNLDLSKTRGLDEVRHETYSYINPGTLQLSRGKIPELFLRGCGLSDWEIEMVKLYQTGLSAKEINDIVQRMYDQRESKPIQINPLFIAYSFADNEFVNRMEKWLNENGIRFWRDVHDAASGRLEKIIDRAMRFNPTVVLVLSKNSVKSDWVEQEVRTARELEKELGRDVLCPVALDEAWKNWRWPTRLREQIMGYKILDFSKWKEAGKFDKMFGKTVEGLDLFYREP